MNEKMIKNYLKSVVSLDVSTYHFIGSGCSGRSSGTGFIIDKELGLLVTCRHLVDITAATIEVTFNNGAVLDARAVYIDPWIDFAILQFDAELAPDDIIDVEMADAFHYAPGHRVITLGANEGVVNSYKMGEVIKLNDIIRRNASHIQTTLDVSGGSSGSPVYTKDGKVIGMHTCGTETMSWELNARYIIDALAYLQRGQLPPRNDIGLAAKGYSLQQSSKFLGLDIEKIKSEFDFKFDHVLYSCRDQNNGDDHFIRPGDVILAIDDILLGDNALLAEQLVNKASGSISVLIMRWGQLMTINVPIRCAYDNFPNEYIVFGGATFHDITDHLRATHRLGSSEGVMLSQALYNSPASSIGYGSKVKADERVCIIREINGERVKSLKDFSRVISKFHNNDYVVFNLEDVLHGWGPALETFRLSLDFYPTTMHSHNIVPMKFNVKRLAS